MQRRAGRAVALHRRDVRADDAIDAGRRRRGLGPRVATLREPWLRRRATRCSHEADAARCRATRAFAARGKRGVHTEHLGYLLAEMQYLQRAYPGGAVVTRAARALRAEHRLRLGGAGAVLDPEVPVLSVVDLGIVRDVAVDGDDASTVDAHADLLGLPGHRGDRSER